MEQIDIPLDQIQTTLDTRGTQYGDFRTQANLSQVLNHSIQQHYYQVHPEGPALPNYISEAVLLICHKLARMANGNPLFIENFRDIAGYSQLVVDILKDDPNSTDSVTTYTKKD